MKLKTSSTAVSLAIAAGVVMSSIATRAQDVAVNGSLTEVALGGGVFDYTLTLNNTGSEAVQALWLGWTVGVFDIVNPTSASSSLGWSPAITGNSIQFGPGTPLASGSTETFSFDSTSVPADFSTGTAGPSVAYGVEATPFAIENTTLHSEEFRPTIALATVPDQSSTLGLLAFGSLGFLSVCRRKLRCQ